MKKSMSGLLIPYSILADLNVRDIFKKDGAAGMGLLVFSSMYLKKCYHAIGFLDDVNLFTTEARKTVGGVKKWICSTEVFKVDLEHGIFYMPMLRKVLKLNPDITERELLVVQKYGNKIKTEPLDADIKECVKTDDESSADAPTEKNKPSADENILHDEQKVFEKRNSQNADTKTVSTSSINTIHRTINNAKGIGIIPKGNNTPIPTTTTISVNDKTAAGAGEKTFFNFLEKKLISCTEWRKSVSRTRDVNLEDDNVLHFFAKWMSDYCISNDNMPADEDKILHYASSLLTKGLRTRKCFDEAFRRDFTQAADGARTETPVRKTSVRKTPAAPAEHLGTFEQLINGRRVGLDNQILPAHAPRQRNANERWSYRLDRYVDVSVWDRNAEEAARLEYERQQALREQAEQQAQVS